MFKKSDKISIRNQIIAGVSIAIIIGFLTYISGIISVFFDVIQSIYSFMVDTVSIPIWLFILLLLLIFSSFIKLIKATFRAAINSEPSFLKYNEDHILGLKWRWDYSSRGEIINICCFCPNCDLQLLPRRTSSFDIIDDICFYCEDCGREIRSFEHNYIFLENKIIRTIQKNLRNNSWVKKIDNES